MTDTPDLAHLKALAEKATPGPWSAMPSFPLYVVPSTDVQKHIGGASDPSVDASYASVIAKVQEYTPDFEGWERFTRRRFNHEQNKADAAYIAAVSPDVLLAFIASHEALRAEHDALKAENERLRGYVQKCAICGQEWTHVHGCSGAAPR